MPEGMVEFTVKELFEQLVTKMDSIDLKLDTKADHAMVVTIAERITVLEQRDAYVAGVGKAAWLAVGLLLAICGMLVPLVLNVI